MGAAVGDLATEIQCNDLVRDAHHKVHVVLDQQHGELETVADALDQHSQCLDFFVIQPGRRLVQQQKPGAIARARASSTRFRMPKVSSPAGICAT